MHIRPLRMLSTRSRGLLALILSAAVLLVSACGTGFNAQTNKVYQAGAGATDRGGEVEVLNGLFVDNAEGTATFSGGLLNKQDVDDTVTSVTGKKDGEQVEIVLDAPIELASGRLFKAGEEPQIVARGDNIKPGYYVTLTFSFSSSAPVEIEVPVVRRSATYDDVALSPSDLGSSQPTDGATEDFPSDENTVEPQN